MSLDRVRSSRYLRRSNPYPGRLLTTLQLSHSRSAKESVRTGQLKGATAVKPPFSDVKIYHNKVFPSHKTNICSSTAMGLGAQKRYTHLFSTAASHVTNR